MKTYKGVLIILDGLGDRPHPALGGRTPLEAAHTPTLDALAQSGRAGLMHPLAPGVPVGTQTGVGLLMGLARADVGLLRRGPVEAAGAGLPLCNGDLAVRCNFATLRPNGSHTAILDRRAGRIDEGTAELAAELDGMALTDTVTARFRPSTQHRAVLVLQGHRFSDAITDTDPGAGRIGEGLLHSRPLHQNDPVAEETAHLINTFVQRSQPLLDAHPINQARRAQGLLPANGLLTRGAGRVAEVRNLVRSLGLKAAVVAEEQTVIGLGQLFGFGLFRDHRFTALPDTDLDAKVATTLTALEDHDLVFLHIKGTDTCAHDKDPAGKQAFLERIDTALTPLLAQPELVLGIASDHSTDSQTGRHIGDPVPVLLRAPFNRADPVAAFSEEACQQGGLGQLNATGFLMTLIDHMNRTREFRPRNSIFFD